VAGDQLETMQEAYEASVRQMRTLLDAQARLREVAEQTAAQTRAELERLAEALCPQWVDELRKGHPLGLSQVKPIDLADVVIRHVQSRLARLGVAEVAGQSVEELYERAAAELAQLRVENSRLETDLDEARQDRDRAELRSALLQQSLEDAQRRLASAARGATTVKTPAPSEATASEASSHRQIPEWLTQWQAQKAHKRDLELLRVLADTGTASRTEAAKLFAMRVDLRPAAGSVTRAFERCHERLGLIELIDSRSPSQGGKERQLIRLTERGRDASRILLQLEPAPSQATELLARHDTPDAAALCLKTAGLLRRVGYEVDLLPSPLALAEGHTLLPDLLASRQGRTLFVAVEHGKSGGAAEGNRKWQSYCDAGGGELYVAVPDKETLDKVKSEILFWASARELVLWMTDLSTAQGKNNESIWTFKRGRRK